MKLPLLLVTRRPALLLIGCLLLGLSVGCGRTEAPGEESAPPATVTWKVASQNALEEWTELVGTTMPLPDRQAHVSTVLGGQVVSVFGAPAGQRIAEGQRVEKGTLLVQLDSTLIKAELAKAVAADDALREEERQAQYAVELANSEIERQRTLMKKSDGGRTQLVTEVERLKADYALKDAQSKLKASKARLVAAAKEQDRLRVEIKLHDLTAPIAGRVGRIQVVPGQMLAAGATVADIVDLDDQIEVLCFVPPGMSRRLSVGQQALSGAIEKESDEPEASGEVVYIAEQAEPETGNFAVKVRFDNKDAHLRANRVLRLRVLTQPGRECLALPEAAVSEDEEVPTVVIVEDIKTAKNDEGKEETTGRARRLAAVLGVRDRNLHLVEIVRLDDPDKEAKTRWQGEVKDQQFVVEGGERLQTGDKVKLEVEGE
jgi:multidrug efflux system membrane fusion protein